LAITTIKHLKLLSITAGLLFRVCCNKPLVLNKHYKKLVKHLNGLLYVAASLTIPMASS